MSQETIDSIVDPKAEIIGGIVYPSLMERVKAIMTDTIVLIILMIIFGYTFNYLNDVSDNVRMFAFIFIVAFYDPLSVSLIGGTPGHILNNLKVRRSSDHNKKVNILLAFIRYGLKLVLGAVSFLTVSTHSEKRAIHDIFTGSIVLYKNQKVQ